MTFIEKFKQSGLHQKLFCHLYDNCREDEDGQDYYTHIIYDEASTPDPDDPNPEDDSWKNNDECYRWVVADDKGNILRFGYGSEGKKYDPHADHRKVGWFVALMKRHGLSGDITV